MDKEKSLALWRFWLFGIYVIVFAAVTVFVGGVLRTGFLIMREPYFWLLWVVLAILFVVWYYIYKAYLNRKA